MSIRWRIAVAILGCTSAVEAADVQLLDPSTFGRNTSEAVKPLFDRKADETAPAYLQLDILCGRYHAATVTYPDATTPAEVSTSLAKRYGQQKIGRHDQDPPWLWRIVEEDGWPLAIQLAKGRDASEGPRVIYIRNAAWVKACAAPGAK